ncbi:hypothetical protein [Schaalia turicensis]
MIGVLNGLKASPVWQAWERLAGSCTLIARATASTAVCAGQQ